MILFFFKSCHFSHFYIFSTEIALLICTSEGKNLLELKLFLIVKNSAKFTYFENLAQLNKTTH